MESQNNYFLSLVAGQDDTNQDIPVVTGVAHDWRIPEALKNYIQYHDLVAVPTLEHIGVSVLASPDGSCGYNAFILGGWYVGLLLPIVPAKRKSWQDKERCADRKWHLKDMPLFRQLMSYHYQTMWMYFRGDEGFANAAETADGKPLAAFKGTKENLFKRIRDQIYHKSVDYKKTVSPAHWLDSQHAWAIASHWKERTIVVYTKGTVTRRNTRIFAYDPSLKKVTMMLKEGAYLSPPPKAITIVHNGRDHFDALRVTRASLNEIFRALSRFCIKPQWDEAIELNNEDNASDSSGSISTTNDGDIESISNELDGKDNDADDKDYEPEKTLGSDGEDNCAPTKDNAHKNNRDITVNKDSNGITDNACANKLSNAVDLPGSPRKPTTGSNLAFSFGSPVKAKLTNFSHRGDLENFRGDNLNEVGTLITTYSSDGVIEVNVPVIQVRKLINVRMSEDGSIKAVNWQNDGKERSSKFNELMSKGYPKYFAPTYKRSRINKPNRGSRGRKSDLGLVVQFQAICSNSLCTTKMQSGWTLEQCEIIGNNEVVNVKTLLRLTGSCHHRQIPKGRLSGVARRDQIEQVNNVILTS